MKFRLGQQVILPEFGGIKGVIAAVDNTDCFYPYMVVFNNSTKHDILSYDEYVNSYDGVTYLTKIEYKLLLEKFNTFNWFDESKLKQSLVLKKEKLWISS